MLYIESKEVAISKCYNLSGGVVKRIILLILILSVPFSAQASSIGGVYTQGKGKFSIGLDGEYIFSRKLEKESMNYGGLFAWEQAIKIQKLYRGSVKLSYGLTDNLDIYCRLGEAGFNYSRVDMIGGYLAGVLPAWGSAKIKGANAFLWALGAKGSYNLARTWLLGWDAQYLTHTNFYKGNGYIANALFGPNHMPISWNGKMTFNEWHFAPFLAKRIGYFTPYVGGRYSYLQVYDKVRDNTDYPLEQSRRYHSEDNFGAFCGLDLNLGNHLSMNVEGRFIDETAISFATAYKF